MKKILATILAFGILAWAGSAMATTYTDTYNANAQYMKGSWRPWGNDDTINWTFDITKDGFTPGTDIVTSATVDLNFTDDGWDWWECATLDVGTNSFSWEVDTGDVNFTLTSLMSLNASGTVAASLTATGGDFYFNTATLTAEGPGTAPVPVPEPATMLLFGTGLFGLMGYSRKRLGKKK